MSRRYGGQSGALPEVNTAHPLARGLRYAWLPIGDRFVDICGGLFATPEGLTLVTPTPDGPAVKFSGAERISYSLASRLNPGNGPRFAWVFRFQGTTDTGQALFHYGDGSANNRFAVYVGNAVTGALTDELITIARVEAGTVNTVGYTSATRSELFDGRVHTIVVISSGTSFALYLDGVPKTLTVGGGSANNGRMDVSGVTTASIGAQYTGTWGVHLTGEILFAGWWVLRNTTTFDFASRLSGPELWELFEAPGSGLWKAAAAGGADVTLPLSGQTCTATAGVLPPSLAPTFTGTSATATAGTLTPSRTLALTGQSATATAGTITYNASGDTNVALTGQAATTAAGTLAPSTTKAATGQAATATAGTLAPARSAAASGQSITTAAGTLTLGIVVPLSGQAGAAQPGTLTYGAVGDVELALTGQALALSTGTLVYTDIGNTPLDLPIFARTVATFAERRVGSAGATATTRRIGRDTVDDPAAR